MTIRPTLVAALILTALAAFGASAARHHRVAPAPCADDYPQGAWCAPAPPPIDALDRLRIGGAR